MPVHLNGAKLWAGCSPEFSAELYGEWHLQCVQDVVVQKFRLQGERGSTGGHGAAHQMNLTRRPRANLVLFCFLFFINKSMCFFFIFFYPNSDLM